MNSCYALTKVHLFQKSKYLHLKLHSISTTTTCSSFPSVQYCLTKDTLLEAMITTSISMIMNLIHTGCSTLMALRQTKISFRIQCTSLQR